MIGFSCMKCAEFSPEEMRLWKNVFQYLGVIVQFAELTGRSGL